MSIRRLCVVSFWVILLLFGNAMAETLFFDDFEGNAEIEWPDVPEITIETDPGNPDNTVLIFDTRNDQKNADVLFLEGFENLTDYTMRAKFNIVGETAEFAAIGLIVRAQSAKEYMLVEPARKRLCCGDPRENILNVFERGGGWPIVAKADIDIELEEWHELSVTVVDKKLTVSLDGKQVTEYGKVPYPKGGFGIREWRSETLIDDVEVFDKEGSSLAVKPQDKLTVTWGRLKASQ